MNKIKNHLIETTMTKRILCLLFFSLLLIFLDSCTKTEVIEYEAEPKNRILTYKVRNTPHEIFGAINQDKNTIEVRLPYYIGLDYILADITLDPGATLLDVDSVEVSLLEDEVQAVAVGDTIQYIVRSEDNKYRTYTITQGYTPHRDPLEVNFKINNTKGGSKEYDGGDLYQRTRGSSLFGAVLIAGNFNSLSLESLKITFTHQVTGEKFYYKDFEGSNATMDLGESNYELYLGWLQGAPLGFYDIHIAHQGREVDLPIGLAISEHDMPTTNNNSGAVTLSDGTRVDNRSTYDRLFTVGEPVTRTLDKRYQGSPAFIGVKRVYVKVDSDVTFSQAPAGFVEKFVGKEVDLQILKSELYELSFGFPDFPEGVYEMKLPAGDTRSTSPFNVYVEYEEDPDLGIAWGKDNLTWNFNASDVTISQTHRDRTLRFSVKK